MIMPSASLQALAYNFNRAPHSSQYLTLSLCLVGDWWNRNFAANPNQPGASTQDKQNNRHYIVALHHDSRNQLGLGSCAQELDKVKFSFAKTMYFSVYQDVWIIFVFYTSIFKIYNPLQEKNVECPFWQKKKIHLDQVDL